MQCPYCSRSIAQDKIAYCWDCKRPLINLLPNPAAIEWVEIPAGEFVLKADSQRKKVELRYAYAISKYPITNEQFHRFLFDHPNYKFYDFWFKGGDNHPVTEIQLNHAEDFCAWVGGRLPTKLEWEKAACGTDGRTYPWGEDWEDGKYCNSLEARIGSKTPINQYPLGVSPYGVWDMSGNVWEWTCDWRNDYQEDKHVKGGCWDWNKTWNKISSSNSDLLTQSEAHGFRPVLAPLTDYPREVNEGEWENI